MLPQLQPAYPIEDLPATIGRHTTNDVRLPYDSVSRFHARIEMHDRGFRVVDLHSSNGTFVNGSRVKIAPIIDQDVIGFGGIELTVNLQPGEGQGPALDKAAETGASVHLISAEDDRVQTVLEADIPQQSTDIPTLEKEITSTEQLKEAKRRLVTFYRLQEILRTTTDEKKLLQRVLRLLFLVIPVDRGVVLTRDKQDANLFNPMATQLRPQDANPCEIGISKTILTRCLKDKVAILTQDAAIDERFNAAESIVIHKIGSVMCVPLISHHHVFGFIHLDTSDPARAFTEDDLAFLANVGHEVAIHLHNIRMLQEKILSERMAAIGQTITGLAHNIKNVLLLTQGGMDLMAKRLHEKNYEALDETWTLVKRGIDRINAMTKDMLDYSRARVAKKTRVHPNEFLLEIQETFAEELLNRKIECKLELQPDCPAIMIDHEGLDRAIVNLLVNAMEASPEGGGRIILRSIYKSEDGCLIFEVEDDAGGIPAEVLPRIFFPFFTTKGPRGSGLGLATTKKFVEDIGGRIDVKSIEGVGSTFTISIFADPSDLRLETPHSHHGRQKR